MRDMAIPYKEYFYDMQNKLVSGNRADGLVLVPMTLFSRVHVDTGEIWWRLWNTAEEDDLLCGGRGA